MTLDELLLVDLHHKNVLLLGRPSAGKTYLSNILSGMYKHHHVIHCDDYKDFSEPVAVQALIEDAYENKPCIVEGVLGYALLLQGAYEKSYKPDIVITCDISAGKQREIYLAERDASKIQFQKRFFTKMLNIMNEYHSLVPVEQKPQFVTFHNEFDAIKK